MQPELGGAVIADSTRRVNEQLMISACQEGISRSEIPPIDYVSFQGSLSIGDPGYGTPTCTDMCRQASCILGDREPAEGMATGASLSCNNHTILTKINSYSLLTSNMRIQRCIKFCRMYVVRCRNCDSVN